LAAKVLQEGTRGDQPGPYGKQEAWAETATNSIWKKMLVCFQYSRILPQMHCWKQRSLLTSTLAWGFSYGECVFQVSLPASYGRCGQRQWGAHWGLNICPSLLSHRAVMDSEV
jgi:hypothetical protein